MYWCHVTDVQPLIYQPYNIMIKPQYLSCTTARKNPHLEINFHLPKISTLFCRPTCYEFLEIYNSSVKAKYPHWLSRILHVERAVI